MFSTLFSLYLDSDNNPEASLTKSLCYEFSSWGLITFYFFFMASEIIGFAKTNSVPTYAFSQELIWVSYSYFAIAGVVLIDTLVHFYLHGDVSFISDIRSVNTLYLALLLLSLDYKDSLDLFPKILDFIYNLFTCCFSKPKADARNASAEVINEVDLIFRKYIVSANYLQPNAV